MSEYKRKSETKTDQDQRISRGMHANIKAFMERFPNEDDLLMATASAKKVKGILILTKFNIADLDRYERKFVKEHQVGLHDAFIFEKLCRSNTEFIPAMFWRRILKQKVL